MTDIKEDLRYGDWMLTYTGKEFYPLDPRVEDLNEIDIAHALAMICRFGGHAKFHYSVAQHSAHAALCVLSETGDKKLAFCALMHDATEAYLGDVVTSIKRQLPEYKKLEKQLWQVIAKRWDLPTEMPAAIHRADMRMLMTERLDVMPASNRPWAISPDDYPPYKLRISAMSPYEAEAQWLELFYALQKP